MKKIKTILVAEDDKTLRKALVDVLHKKNFITLEAQDGKKALHVALDKKPDLILLDLLMPEIDGIEVLKKIRHNTWWANVPVIILTNLNPTKEDLVQDVILHKPALYLIKSDWGLHDIVHEIEKTLYE
jgi:DNA-binding response OmpR family regulator